MYFVFKKTTDYLKRHVWLKFHVIHPVLCDYNYYVGSFRKRHKRYAGCSTKIKVIDFIYFCTMILVHNKFLYFKTILQIKKRIFQLPAEQIDYKASCCIWTFSLESTSSKIRSKYYKILLYVMKLSLVFYQRTSKRLKFYVGAFIYSKQFFSGSKRIF